mmetsp:Transcript_15422/g.22917  ORF Transcript_15422/g.22917 Transcript_15422/m.22917 type:complete len:355 (-) Transcript_15422:19-1083(-)
MNIPYGFLLFLTLVVSQIYGQNDAKFRDEKLIDFAKLSNTYTQSPSVLYSELPTLSPTSMDDSFKSYAPTSSEFSNNFNIKLIKYGDSDEKYDVYVEKAKARWESIIIGDLYDIPAISEKTNPGGWFGYYLPDEKAEYCSVDDIIIAYNFKHIDGIGKKLGYTAITAIREYEKGSFPISSIITLDLKDIEILVQEKTFGNVILHEMGHALGFSSTMWVNYESGCGISCELYNERVHEGCKASQIFNELGFEGDLKLYSDGVLNDGKYCSHWDENQLGDELMTPYISIDGYAPLSAITIGAFQDMGYEVSYESADDISLIQSASNHIENSSIATHMLKNRENEGFDLISPFVIKI